MIIGKLGKQLEKCMDKNLNIMNVDIAEIYSTPRISSTANSMGLKGGWSLDLTTTDVDGAPWDFSKLDMRNRALRLLLTTKPVLLVGSPPCTDMGIFRHANFPKMNPDEVLRRKSAAEMHIRFCCKLYEIQRAAGRYFLHEHPQASACWTMPQVERLLRRDGVLKVVAHMCRFGMISDCLLYTSPSPRD